ncbi:hypothetical protein TIFTF001_036237 [Ficus carica]|uniref:Uncharacterized protein n=1 Tax=Ficus carica TaxID=3494 RepID=A0AA88J7E9_FICCA|nr:hypothetical protein TIFTF001_036237 [Ficus carica]
MWKWNGVVPLKQEMEQHTAAAGKQTLTAATTIVHFMESSFTDRIKPTIFGKVIDRFPISSGGARPVSDFVGRLFTIKSDVFSFHVLVLEIITGKKSRGFHGDNHGLTHIGHAWMLHNEGNTFGLLDQHSRELVYDLKQVLRCIHIGLLL